MTYLLLMPPPAPAFRGIRPCSKQRSIADRERFDAMGVWLPNGMAWPDCAAEQLVMGPRAGQYPTLSGSCTSRCQQQFLINTVSSSPAACLVCSTAQYSGWPAAVLLQAAVKQLQ
jgi:hypothetical protein